MMKNYEVIEGKEYKITYPGIHKGKKAKVIFKDNMGDCTLKFKNGREVCYHAGWLESA